MALILNGDTGITYPVATATGSATQASAGRVLQVVNATYGTVYTTSSSTFSDTGLTASITPSSTTSKILVNVTVNGAGKNSSNSTTGLAIRLVRNSTAILNMEGFFAYTGTSLVISASSGTCYLDSPATTSATTYKIQIASTGNTATVFINNYYSSQSEVNSTITLMEISA
jgi:hypothetical protein